MREGNSKYYHGFVAYKQHHNMIKILEVKGSMIEGVDDVWIVVQNHFVNHFKSHTLVTMYVNSLHFSSLDGGDLFSETFS